jgi:hypothetical protein
MFIFYNNIYIILNKYNIIISYNRGGSQDFIKKYPKNTDTSPILGTKGSTKIVQKGYDFIFFSLKESFSLVLYRVREKC